MANVGDRMGSEALDSIEVAVVGTGFGGIGMAVRLLEAGYRDIAVFEKADKVGGTWRENTYPGCACDVPSHLYSFSFAPNPDWSRMFSGWREIRDYIEDVARRFGVMERIRFGHELTAARFDEATSLWHLTFGNGETVKARYVVAGLGPLHEPVVPDLPGLKEFKGPAFHSAQWRHDVDLTGKRIAVIGTGASAIQFVPQIAPGAGQVDLYQRTPPWVMPKPDREITAFEKWMFRTLPFTQRLWRYWQYWTYEMRGIGFVRRPSFMERARRMGEEHIAEHIANPELRAKLTPDYLPGCKRILIANDYYPALARDNVSLVTEGIDRITAEGIIGKDGVLRPADVIIFGTGFEAAEPFHKGLFAGVGGRDIKDVWAEKGGAEAYKGVTVAGFPNLFLLAGPNTGLGNNSIVFILEAQIGYILDCLAEAKARRAGRIEVTDTRQADYNREIQEMMKRTIWMTGCNSWYLNANGKNTTIWPGFSLQYHLRMKEFEAADYNWS